MGDKLTERIQTLIMPHIQELSAELVELRLKYHRGRIIVDIIADRPEGGITIGECTSINKRVTQVIEQHQCLGEDYVVEVSSPGLDRALTTLKDFSRAIGRKVRFHLFKPIEEKKEHLGEVAEVQGNQILIKKKTK